MTAPLVSEVEVRILRACKTIRALPDREARFFRYGSMWPSVAHSTEEAYGYDEARLPRFKPSPADVSDCLTALEWARAVPRREFKLVWWRSLGWSYRHIAARLGRSHETARQRYRDVILNLWMAATHQNAGLANLTQDGRMAGKSDIGGLCARRGRPARAFHAMSQPVRF